MWDDLLPKLRGERVLSLRRVALVGAGNIGAQGFGFLATLLLAQAMAEADYGAFRTLLSIGMLLGMAIWTGLPNSLIFFGGSADGRPRRSAATSAALAQSAGLLVLFAVPLVLFVSHGVFLSLFLVGMTLFTIASALLRAGLLFRRYASFQFVAGAARVSAVVLLVLTLGWQDPITPLLITAFAWFVALPWVPRAALAVLRVLKDMPTREAHRAVAAYATPVTMSSSIVLVFLNVDLLLVAAFWGTEQAALYGIARSFATAFGVVPAALAMVLFSEVSAQRDIDLARRRLRSGLRLVGIASGLLFVLAIPAAPWLLDWLLPTFYGDAYVPLLLLGVGTVAYGVASLWDSVLTALGHPLRVLGLYAVLLPVDLLAVGVGAWQWGPEGAAAGTALGMLLGMALFVLAGRRMLVPTSAAGAEHGPAPEAGPQAQRRNDGR